MSKRLLQLTVLECCVLELSDRCLGSAGKTLQRKYIFSISHACLFLALS